LLYGIIILASIQLPFKHWHIAKTEARGEGGSLQGADLGGAPIHFGVIFKNVLNLNKNNA